MISCNIKIQLLNQNAKIPCYGSTQAAGADICACLDYDYTLKKGSYALISTGIAIELPIGYEAQIRPRSGLAAKFGVTVLNTPGTIDSDYRGEIKVILINHSDNDFVIHNGDRIAQMVIAKHETASFDVVSDLNETIRGEGGFGSTGINTDEKKI